MKILRFVCMLFLSVVQMNIISAVNPVNAASKNAAHKNSVKIKKAVFKKIEFSGYTWKIKDSDIAVEPGSNYFSDSAENVWVDENGRLHLKILQRDGKWYCSEVFTELSLGYGKYVFYVDGRIDKLDKNIVFGLFSWDYTAPGNNYREIDIEFSKLGQEINDNVQYVVQPWYKSDNIHRFNVELLEDKTTHSFNWRADSISFQSLYGHQYFPGGSSGNNEIASWVYTGNDIPPAGQVSARINLWLYNGNAPSNGETAEVIIEAFEFIPHISNQLAANSDQ